MINILLYLVDMLMATTTRYGKVKLGISLFDVLKAKEFLLTKLIFVL